MYYNAPTYNLDSNTWEHTPFETRKDVVKYIDSQFKYPGEYNLKYTEGFWNAQGKTWQQNKSYPVYVKNSIDYKKHWDSEKAKCSFEGFVIYKKKSENVEFAVPGLFYWYLNYCPIVDKLKRKTDLPEIYDGDYHYFLYILLCILRRKYGVVLKKRQAGYTLKNMSILLNVIWFGESAVSKIFAFDINKVNDSWTLMENYRNHINQYCGWKRGFAPDSKLDWQVRRKKKDGSGSEGNMSIAKGFTTKQDPTNGVGGTATVIFGEESGMNPKLDLTHEYVTSNVGLGGLTTGLIIYSGAVGELEKADPLKQYILKPEDYDFLACENKIEDDLELGKKVGFFAPEWWNYVSIEEDEDGNQYGEALRCYDQWGNTDKELALKEILRHRKKAESKKPESFRYYCSQRPLSIREAFAFRKESKFPLYLVEAQEKRISDKTYPYQFIELERNSEQKLYAKISNKLPISEWPISTKTINKEGVIVMWEPPVPNADFLTYFASIDPVGEGKTTTSESLCSIYIYKNDTQVTQIKNGEQKVFIEPGKIVAAWCGRFDDMNKTHERLEMMLEFYNAWTIVENNISHFIQYLIHKKKQKYLAKKDDILFLKEHGANESVYQDYGWKNTGMLFKKHILDYGIEFLKEVIGEDVKDDGTIVKKIYGIERIPDIMLLKEMKGYGDNVNTDRLVSFCALVAFVKVQQANRGLKKRLEEINPRGYKEKEDPYKINKSPFNHIGSKNASVGPKLPRNPFKNLR